MPAEWQLSKVSRRNVNQARKTLKTVKLNETLYSFSDFPESSATNFYVISHLQVSQIPKIKSQKGTGTWNPNRMTTFQGRSAKRQSN